MKIILLTLALAVGVLAAPQFVTDLTTPATILSQVDSLNGADGSFNYR